MFPFLLAQAAEPAEEPAAQNSALPPAAADAIGADAGEAADAAGNAAEAADPGFIADFFDSGALGLLLDGGPFMWPILILGIVAIAVIIERYRSLKMLNNNDAKLREQVLELLTQDRVEDARNLCDSQRGPVAAILSNGLRKYIVLRRLGYDPAKIEEQVLQSMENYSVHIVAALERHLPILATVSSVAPMVGFLGTVQGMIVSFANIVATMGEVNIVEAAASGIQVALLTTCFGLIVGIPAFLGFNYFSGVINSFVLEVETTSTELIELITMQLTLAENAGDSAMAATGNPAATSPAPTTASG
jgi:biopolymer transport protein ExbB